MKLRNKLTIAVVAILANLIIVNFAFAQTATINPSTNLPVNAVSGPSVGPILTKQSYIDSQKDEASCVAFSEKVMSATNGQYKAVYQPLSNALGTIGDVYNTVTSLSVHHCFIVESTFDTTHSADTRTLGAIYLETAIYNSTDGISQSSFTGIQNQAEKDSNAASAWSKVIGWAVSSIVKMLTALVLWLTATSGKLLSYSLSQTAITELPPVVKIGWTLVRDLFNMVFILAIIIMSLATILRRETYNARRLILRLIMVAILINFSQVIVLTIIQAVDNITRMFISHTDITSYWNTMKNIIFPGGAQNLFSSGGVVSDTVQSIAGLLLAVIMMSAFLAMAGLMVVRLIGLYLIIILSPAALTMYILPGTQQYWNTWRSYFVKYLIYAPSAAFLLYLGNLFFKGGANQGIYTGGDSAFNMILIAAFYWMAFYITKTSGIQGAATVAKWADGTSRFVSKYVARGSAAKHAGQFLEKVPVISRFGTGLKKTGENWQKVAQHIEAAPGTAKHALDVAGKDYAKGVAKAGRAQRRVVSKILPFDTESLEKDDVKSWDADEVERVTRSRIESGKLSAADLMDYTGSMSKKAAVAGLIKMYDKHVSGEQKIAKFDDDPAFVNQIEEAINKKSPYKIKLQKLDDPNDKTRTGYYFDGDKVWIQGTKKSKRKGETPETQEKYKTKFDVTERSGIADFLTDDEEVSRQKSLTEKKERYQRSLEAKQALEQSGMDAQTVQLELQNRANTLKDIYAINDFKRIEEEIRADEGDSARIDLRPEQRSLLSRSGQRVILSSKLSGMPDIDMELDEERYVPKEELAKYVKALRETHEMVEEDINRLIAAAEKAGGIQMYRGVERPFSPILSEQLTASRKQEVQVKLRAEQKYRKEGEGIHSLFNLMRRTNENLYRAITDRVINYDSQKFTELANELKKFEEYRSLSNQDLAEEIITNQKLRAKLPQGLQTELESKMGKGSSINTTFRKTRFTTAKAINADNTVAALVSKWEKRSGQKVDNSLHSIKFDSND